MGTIGRLYVYIVALVSLLVAAYGAGSLLSTIGKVFLQSGMEITPGISFWRTTISTYTPMLLVGGAIWAIHWLGIRGRVAQSIDEQQAVLSKLFINGILTIASIFALLNAVRLIYHVISTVTNASMPPLDIRGRPWDVYNALVWLVVYAMIWYYYWQVDEEEGRSTASGVTLRRWYVYITSLVSLGVLGIGLYFSLSLIISYLVRGTAVQIVGGGLGSLLRNWSLTLAPILGGFLWWWLHWLRVARGDIESVLRQVYLYLWTFLGVAGTAGAAGSFVYQILKFAFGYRAPSWTSQLSFLQFTTPLIIVAASSWAYHWRVVQEEAPHTIQSLPGIRRRYNYLVSALGLLALTIGLGSLLRILLEIAFQVGPEMGRTPDWWRDQLSAFIAAALVGLVVWLPHWRRIAQIVRDREPEEVTALSRRIYLFMILFVAVLAILFNGAQALNGLLRLVLGETASRRFLSSLFTNIGNVTVVGLFLFYHWRVLQRDRVVIGAMPQQRSIAVTALAADVFQGKVNQLQEALGSKVALLREVSHTEGIPDIHEGGFSPDELADIMSKVHDSPSAKVLLVFTSSGVEVHPYT